MKMQVLVDRIAKGIARSRNRGVSHSDGAAFDYHDQKFVLFKKLADGRIKKVETFNEPISWEQAISRYGPGRYLHQSMKPRTKTIWNHLSASSTEESEKNEVHVIELQRVERKTKYLTAGLVGLGVGTAIGFGAT